MLRNAQGTKRERERNTKNEWMQFVLWKKMIQVCEKKLFGHLIRINPFSAFYLFFQFHFYGLTAWIGNWLHFSILIELQLPAGHVVAQLCTRLIVAL